VAAAFAVLVAGFGALLGFWWLGTPPRDMPGLFDFASATWGDGLLLPAMTGFLLTAVRGLPRARLDRVLACVGAVIGFALGLASQAMWLAADAPRPNWTLPHPHSFTAAGWYHALFVTAICTSTAALLGGLVNRATAASHWPRTATAGMVAGLCFMALLAKDVQAGAAPDGGHAGLTGTILGATTTAAVAATLMTRRRKRVKPPT
jgi:hypothetical protein